MVIDYPQIQMSIYTEKGACEGLLLFFYALNNERLFAYNGHREVINMLPDIERKLLRILYNYSAGRRRIISCGRTSRILGISSLSKDGTGTRRSLRLIGTIRNIKAPDCSRAFMHYFFFSVIDLSESRGTYNEEKQIRNMRSIIIERILITWLLNGVIYM
ncbi:hypothetical protein D3C74_253630 [compost metagenome]